uniref:Excalibur calcium-binding domain-containing protein n=1 Tax=Chrysotila carterae TaxID=13221 RepID=A0A7S4C0Z4_CHRCT
MQLGTALRPAAQSLISGLLAISVAWSSPETGSCAQQDKVVRVLSANSIKLENLGVVNLAGSYTPSRLPNCFTYTPQAHLRQLLPPKTLVQVETQPGRPKGTEAFITRERDGLFVNEQLVRGGWAKASVRGAEYTERLLEGQKQAQREKLGLWVDCSVQQEVADDDQFEPLAGSSFEYNKVTAVRSEPSLEPPKNPGDTKNCADFADWEESNRFFVKYYPFYGDVAKLDRDNDGIPCPGLPHTSNPERWMPKQQGLPPRVSQNAF